MAQERRGEHEAPSREDRSPEAVLRILPPETLALDDELRADPACVCDPDPLGKV